MQTFFKRFVTLGVATITLGSVPLARAADAPTPEQLAFFEQKVRPVLVKHCYGCHSEAAEKVKGGLRLDTKAGWQLGGDSGDPAIVVGNPEESLLLRVIRHQEAGLEMPPKEPKLPDSVAADLAAWIKMGAPDPRDGAPLEVKRADKSWWSLQPLTHPQPPVVKDLPAAWAHNPIDQFIAAKLQEQKLRPSGPADRRTLIRRVSYDLIGLPPTPEEVAAFVADPDPAAYEKLVDRLLASPHYGERWGRHWLDVVRFGESNGFERNFFIDNAWPFRDYVINSLNQDIPFNQLMIEHLAGDVVAKDQPDREVGVAFLTIGPYDDVGNQDVIAAANIRATTVDDMVTATGNAFLGLTINCARCHHHKFDPIPTEDYYRIKSAFDGVKHGPRTLSSVEQRKQRQDAVQMLEARKKELLAQREQIEKTVIERAIATPSDKPERPQPSAALTEETFAPVAAKAIQFRILATTNNPLAGNDARLDEFEVWTSDATPRNVALAETGAKATGATGRVAKDAAEAYGIELVNDGKYGRRWFVGSPADLTITFAKSETIHKVVFSHDRTAMVESPVPGLGPAAIEYEILISPDGEKWEKVADSFDRKAATDGLLKQRRLQRTMTDAERQQIAAGAAEIAKLDQSIRSAPQLPQVWAGQFSQPGKPTVVFRGGDPQKPGEEILPSSLEVLATATKPYTLPANAPESERRVALAKWIASDENPLTARVLANRLWHYHFGTGIVDTPSDFGFLGGKPTHPELLDWLASRLHQHGWKLKALHREIVTSQTYQQASTYREDAAKLDQESRYLWRFPPRRLAAEEIRDTLLTVSGKLDRRPGGPGFRLYEAKQDNVSTYTPLEVHGPETYRRAVYHQNVRASVVDVLSDFDLPDNAFAAPRRASTTTPMQALTMLNHRFTLDMAAALAARVIQEAGPEPAAQIDRLYLLTLQRPPSANERSAAQQLVTQFGLPAVCRALLNANELLLVE